MSLREEILLDSLESQLKIERAKLKALRQLSGGFIEIEIVKDVIMEIEHQIKELKEKQG